MTPQSTFMVVAPIADGRRGELEALLATMTSRCLHGRSGQWPGAVRRVRSAACGPVRRPGSGDHGRHRRLRRHARALAAGPGLPRRLRWARGHVSRRTGRRCRRRTAPDFRSLRRFRPEHRLAPLDDCAYRASGRHLRQLDRSNRGADPRRCGIAGTADGSATHTGRGVCRRPGCATACSRSSMPSERLAGCSSRPSRRPPQTGGSPI